MPKKYIMHSTRNMHSMYIDDIGGGGDDDDDDDDVNSDASGG